MVHPRHANAKFRVLAPIIAGKQEEDMERVIFITGGVLLVLILAVGVSMPKKGTVERLSEIHDTNFGNIYLVGRYDGLGSGWDVAFFHRTDQGLWHGYYLAHESPRWRQGNLEVQGNLVIVNNGEKRMAEYDVRTGLFLHKHSGVVFPSKDALDEGGKKAAEWNLP